MGRERSPLRRRLLFAGLGAGLGAGVVAGAAGLVLALNRHHLVNPCLADLPAELATDPLIEAAWAGLDPAKVWDCHAHVAGTGDSGRGIEISPRMLSPLYPFEYLQRMFYLNAGCTHAARGVDDSYVERLRNLMGGLAPGAKLMLLAFDHVHDEDGTPRPDLSAFFVPNDYAREIAQASPQWFEWVCSIHPWRADAVDALEAAVAGGARAVKWLPPAMGIDPAAPACDRFYRAMQRLDVPLLTHGGAEEAVRGAGRPEWGNPLRLRRALDQGVRVVMAHCATHGEDVDSDHPGRKRVPSFALFARMMDEPAHAGLLFGDISATVLRNRDLATLRTLIERPEWHARLLYGSDYPLPGILPLISIGGLAQAGMLAPEAVPVLEAVRRHNPLLFSFVLKRHLHSNGRRFGASVFETRPFFDRSAA